MTDQVWQEERLEAEELLIRRINAAMLAVISGAQHYSLDTGQTKQSVTKTTLPDLERTLEKAMKRRDDLLVQLGRNTFGSQVRVIPGF